MDRLWRPFVIRSVHPSGEVTIAPEITIAARSRMAAQRALNLLQACNALLAGEVIAFVEDAIAIPSDLADTEDLDLHERAVALQQQCLGAPNLGSSCLLAAKASRRREHQYAAHKLFLSFRTASAAIVDLDPTQGPNRFRTTDDPMAHVALASAITLAYSAIEELKLEPRGSHKKPSSRPDGSWDPDCLANLEQRLKAARVDVAQPIAWSERGGSSRIDLSRKRPGGDRFRWAVGPVRDRKVRVADALRMASWLRSTVTTHKFRPETRSLKLYDVHNVQFLARRLFLESTGFWGPDTPP